MPLDLVRVHRLLRDCDRRGLFGEELGWDHQSGELPVTVKGEDYELTIVAGKDYANCKSVIELLKVATYRDAELSRSRYIVKKLGGKRVSRVDYVGKLYADLCRARCDLLHGNPVSARSFFPSRDRGGPSLMHCAPLVYRVAVLAFLNLGCAPVAAAMSTGCVGGSYAYRCGQAQFERALLACRRGGEARK